MEKQKRNLEKLKDHLTPKNIREGGGGEGINPLIF